MSITLHKTEIQLHQRYQHKTGYTQSNEEKAGNCLELLGTGDNFLKRTPITQVLRSTITKWDLIKLKRVPKAKDIINTRNVSL